MRRFYLLGYPLNHSLSPLIHTTLYKHFNIEASYSLKPVSQEELKNFISKRNFFGCNVTSPYKSTVSSLVDALTDEAKECGSVNTLYFNNKTLVGDNTDGLGFLNVLRKKNISLKNKTVMIIGAGALAQTVLQKIRKENIQSVMIANRTLEKAEKLNPSAFCGLEEISSFLPEIDVLINTIVIPDLDPEDPVFKMVDAQSGCQFMDFTYNKCKTFSGRTNYISGEEFLLAQALLSFQKWFPKYNKGSYFPSFHIRNFLHRSPKY